MGLGPVGAGPASSALTPTAAAQPLVPVRANSPGPAALAVSPAVIDAAFLSVLSEPDLARLMAVLDPAQSPHTTERASQLLQAAVTAAAAGDAERALTEVGSLAALEPLRADAIRAQPGLEPVRPQVETLLARIANLARLDAEGRVDQAGRAVESGVVRTLPEWNARPEALVRIATQLLDAGGHANAVRASQVAQVVLDAAPWAPVAVPIEKTQAAAADEKISAVRLARESDFGNQARARLVRLWRRGPLLVLLLGWLGIGLAGGFAGFLLRRLAPEQWPSALTEDAFDFWGLGFLARVLFGFYVRVRNVRL